ncbi:MAG: serine hydrolase domain-containing protein [Pseudomonadota bacterium]
MKKLLFPAAITVLALAIWCVAVFFAFSEGWFRSPITSSAEPAAFLEASETMVSDAHPGNFAMILIEDGEIAGSHYTSIGNPVGAQSRFQVASLSKWLTAWGVMTLVEEGRLDLDAPIETYLTRWELPDGPFDEDGVTVRRLLSHTAGLGDSLGYQGFGPGEQVQTLEESLTRARDASANANGAVTVTAEPGSGWSYSGGGYTLLQLIVEEVTGRPFAAYMQEAVFDPLGMADSSFDHEMAARGELSENFDTVGRAEPYRRYTALAATALYTSAEDMARFVVAQAPGAENPVLSDDSRAQMRDPHGRELGADIWGLGTMLYARNGRGDFIIGHDGNNEPAINTAVRLDPDTGDGIVILETGAPILATEIAGEWVFWKTGNVDFLLFTMAIEAMLIWILAGGIIIVMAAAFWAWHRWSRT